MISDRELWGMSSIELRTGQMHACSLCFAYITYATKWFRLTGGTDERDIGHSGMPYSQLKLKFVPVLFGCVCMFYITGPAKLKKECENTVCAATAETTFTR